MEFFSEYFKKDHLFSQIDARVKLSVSLLVLTMVLSYKGLAFPLFILVISLVLCTMMKIPLRVFLLRFSEPFFIACVIILLKFISCGQEVIFSIKVCGIAITGYNDGLINGLQIASRILGAVSIMIVLGFSMPFIEFMSALSWMRMPKGFVEILMLAYRYVFLLLEDAMIIYHAQKNRLGYSNIKQGLCSFGTLTGSLVLKAFDHSQHVTVAMIQRGYDGNIPMLKHKPFKFFEVVAGFFIIIAMGVVWKM